jgi:hypothetical protein
MRRLLRILLNAAIVLSLMLCVAVVVLWVRGYWVTDAVEWGRHNYETDTTFRHSARWMGAFSGRGGVALSWTQVDEQYRYVQAGVPPFAYRHVNLGIPPIDYLNRGPDPFRIINRWGLQVVAKVGPQEMYTSRGNLTTAPAEAQMFRIHRRHGVAIPYWALLVASAALPAGRLTIVLRRRSRRSRPYACPSCGYDLRATPDRCPECGAVPNAQDARAPEARSVNLKR